MPSESLFNNLGPVPPPEEIQQPIAKPCQHCHKPIFATTIFPANAFISAQLAGISNYCSECRANGLLRLPIEHPEAQRVAPLVLPKEPQQGGDHDIDVPRRLLRRPDDMNSQVEEEVVGDENVDSDVEMNGEVLLTDDIGNPRHPRVPPRQNHGELLLSIPPQQLPRQLARSCSPVSPASPAPRFAHPPRSPVRYRPLSPSDRRRTYGRENDGYPDPLVDITRLRVRPKGHKCLYPGARFEGTQKSGRNSYDVSVTIVNVDFSSSYLCGYLSIKGLTEEWPELTTYFDAQIIGDRYGFVTDDWGAGESEDLLHWQRFPAFGIVRSDVKEKRMLLPNNTSRSAIFMRWKEHFLVPDHKVEDISGASFAGFYYVCIDLAPPPKPRSSQEVPTGIESAISPIPMTIPTQPYSVPIYDSSLPPWRVPASTNRSASKPTNMSQEYTATMTGFYFHQNSEPYQQLSLTHVKDRFHSSFEFR